MNKKGVGVDDFIPLLILILFFFFFIGFILVTSTNQAESAADNADGIRKMIVGQDILVNYLSMKKEAAQDNLDDIISAANQNRLSSLEGTFDPYFNPIYPGMGWNTWYITIQAGDMRFETAGIKGVIYRRNEVFSLPPASIHVPLSTDKPLSIKLERVGDRGLAAQPLEMP